VALRIISRSTLRLPELSGFAVREGGRGRELLCVGDREHALLSAPLEAGGAVGPARRHDLEGLAGSAASSGFEGVACDGAGRALVLQEGESRVLVLDAALSRREAVVDLVVAPGQPGFGREWDDDENARGEGLLLMAAGHLLVAKQKEPVCLVEFGPPGDAALGVGPGTLLAPGGELALPGGGGGRSLEYGVLGWWLLSERAADRIESANDLAPDDGGRVLLVSSRSRRIARLAGPLDPASHVAELDDDWRLPDLPGRGRPRPEALCVVPDAVLVGLDSRDAGDNVVALEPLP
jgi:hypothetical protein